MPLTFADGGSISPIADNEAVNATVANRPHTVLKTRTEEIQDFVDESESLELYGRGVTLYSDEIFTWGGPSATGTGVLSFTNNGTGELRIQVPGLDQLTLALPWNELASFMGVTTLDNGDMLCVDLTDYATWGALTGPVGLTAAELTSVTVLTKYLLPIGRVYDDNFVFAYTGDVLLTDIPASIGSYGSEAGLHYGRDYRLTGLLLITENAGNLEVHKQLSPQARIDFSSPSGVTHNLLPANPMAILGNDEVAYAELDFSASGATAVVAVAPFSTYVPAPNHLPLWVRPSASAESTLGLASLEILPHGDDVPVKTGAVEQFSYAGYRSNTFVGNKGVEPAGRVTFLQNASGAASGLAHDGKWVVDGTNVDITHTDAAGAVAHSYDFGGGGGTAKFELPSSSTVQIAQAGGGTGVVFQADGKITAGAGLEVTGDAKVMSAADRFKHNSTQTRTVYISAAALRAGSNTAAEFNDSAGTSNYWECVFASDPTPYFSVDLTPYLIDGATVTAEAVYASSDDAATTITGAIFSRAPTVTAATGIASWTGTLSGVIGTIDTVSDTDSFVVDKSSNTYWARLFLTLASGSKANLYGMGITMTFTAVERPG